MDEQQSESPVQPDVVYYPPKFQKPQDTGNIWWRSILSLALYLALGYYIFHSFTVLLIITAIVIFHELGHFAAMKIYRYKDLGIFFIPLLGAYVSGSKREVSQKESAVILLAGPLPGIIVGLLLFYFGGDGDIGGVSLSRVALLLIILNLINLLPVYPLDGGQLLHRVFLDEEGWLGKAFVFVSAAFLAWIAIKIPVYPLLIFPALMLVRLFSENKMEAVEKKIEAAGISLDISYEDLSDENYWQIRKILIEEHAAFHDQPAGPPFQYSPKEEKLMTAIEGMLHRHLIQDMSLGGKLFVLLIWIAAIAAPWLLQMEMEVFRRLGF
ncbi:MAG TPA: site-2 protease family protein [Chitinophagaceae bacterium]|nr:site-2 protease family protein [Chitinophagaceae bacterium]